jgi:hypothetical protein
MQSFPNQKMPEKQELAGRNSDGTFKEGVSGNPNGRPAISIVGVLREKLKEIPEGQKKSWLEQSVDVILKKAITEEDEKMLRDMIDRIDGKPKQNLGIEGEVNATIHVVSHIPDADS